MSDYFPPLDSATLKHLVVVKKLHQQDPTYLARSDYPVEIRMLFPPTEPVKVEPGEKPKGELDLLEELKKTYTELEEHKPPKDDSTAYMSYFRVRSKLLSDILSEITKAQNSKQISEFYSTVLEALEECAPDQVNKFKEMITK